MGGVLNCTNVERFFYLLYCLFFKSLNIVNFTPADTTRIKVPSELFYFHSLYQ